ncbi:MAG TPA: GNAT family acetyltransferase [Terriglobia bacterium]|jgi:hypothetical protein
MNLLRIYRSVCRTARNHGSWPALYDVVMRTTNRWIYYKNLQCLIVESINTRSFDLPPGFRFLRLEEQALLDFSKDPANELRPDFVRYALAKGDECYGIFEGDQLANYGWYSRKPTLMDNEELFLHFDPQIVYMYKGFTLDRYRGLRLHAISKTRALAEFLSRGSRGMVFYIESNNFNSIKSAYRMGARDCGRIRVVRLMGRYIVRVQSGCRQYGLTLNPNPA